jgi:hypothetical protein
MRSAGAQVTVVISSSFSIASKSAGLCVTKGIPYSRAVAAIQASCGEVGLPRARHLARTSAQSLHVAMSISYPSNGPRAAARRYSRSRRRLTRLLARNRPPRWRSARSAGRPALALSAPTFVAPKSPPPAPTAGRCATELRTATIRRATKPRRTSPAGWSEAVSKPH